MQGEAPEPLEENRDLKEQIRVLNQKQVIKGSLVFDGNAYWLIRPGSDPPGASPVPETSQSSRT